MPEYRTDPISRQTVIVAPERASRPNAFASIQDSASASGTPNDQRGEDATATCPFCRGNEAQTPATLSTYPAGCKSTDWQVRVVPNLYPIVGKQEDATSTGGPDVACGQHEVVIEGPDHRMSLAELTPSQIESVVLAYADRMEAHRDAGAAYTQVFKNNGLAAGASLAHNHSQIVGVDRVPPQIQSELNSCRQFADEHHECLLCSVLRDEQAVADRIVFENGDFLVYCPYASRLPYELCIVPRKHQPHFWRQTMEQRIAFAGTLYQTVVLLEKLEKQLPFNYLIHTAPFDIESDEHYHWHLELVPRFARQAGFEWGTGWNVNPVAPETAAAELRALRGAVAAFGNNDDHSESTP